MNEADLDSDLALAPCAFDAAISFDVALHLRDRRRVFREIARALVPGGRFLFTDAAVVSGAISSEDVAMRSVHGFAQFCPPSFNERTLEHSGFILLETEDRTQSLLKNARGRLDARARYQAEFEQLEGVAGFARLLAVDHFNVRESGAIPDHVSRRSAVCLALHWNVRSEAAFSAARMTGFGCGFNRSTFYPIHEAPGAIGTTKHN